MSSHQTTKGKALITGASSGIGAIYDRQAGQARLRPSPLACDALRLKA